MSAFNDEELQIEALRRWWGRNWKGLTGGLVVGLAVIIGWQLWSHHEAAHRLRASQLYHQFSRAISGNGNGDAKALIAKLKHSYSDTPYAGMADLKLAQINVSNGHFKKASNELNWVTHHGQDAGIRTVARLRLAMVLWQTNKPDQALSLLEKRPPQQFRGLYEMLRGDIFVSQRQDSRARQAYEQALLLLPQGSPERKMVHEKLANIAKSDNRRRQAASTPEKSGNTVGAHADRGAKKP